MKKPLSFLLLGSFILTSSLVSATSNPDTQLIDQISSWSNTTNAASLKFTQAKSCESIQEMLKKYAKERPTYTYSRWRSDWMMLNSVQGVSETKSFSAESSLDLEDASYAIESPKWESMFSSSTDYSTTNIQKAGVDEPEIIKTDGKYFYYYNYKTDKISILSSPLDLDKATLDPNNLAIVKEIAIPQGLDDIELFIGNDRLVLMGDYWSSSWDDEYIFNGSRTILAIYDISDITNLKLLKFENLPWYYETARLIDNQLYVVTQQSLNWYYWPTYDFNIVKGLSSVEVTEKWADVKTMDCSNISYVLPEDEDLKLNPTFTIVTALNIKDTAKDIETTALLSPSWEIHMSKNSLYLVSNFYTPNKWSCPRWLLCTSSYYWWTTQTLVHKFQRNGLALKYENTSLVWWQLLNQYSMDEDANGNFRILTKTRNPKLATNLYVLDKNLNLAGKLENIEPEEEFKSSRYIGDKLYLVTFEQIDPLFVVDIADIKNPKIIWELEIPGYSTYLHPLKVDGTKQYLLWLWYSTADNGWWGVINSWVKLSLFEIDYAKKDSNDYISVKELSSLTQWGKGSNSDALTNPRLFVMDKNYNVTLPLSLSEQKTDWQNCSVYYDENGNEKEKNCYPVTRQVQDFLGLKTFNVTPENGIKETFAKNYLEEDSLSWTVSKNKWYLSNMRVGYVGDALYTFNPLFADFIFPNKTSKAIIFK